MNTEDMLQEVNRRVSEKLLEHIFPKAIKSHIKKEWGTCDCSYCRTKRQSTFDIAHIQYREEFLPKPLGYNELGDLLILSERIIDPKTLKPVLMYVEGKDYINTNMMVKETLRNDLREKYRKKLSKLIEE